MSTSRDTHEVEIGLRSGAHGHELAKVTDFSYTGGNVPSERQNYLNGEPYQAWDGRGIETLSLHQDGSGLPSEIRHTVSPCPPSRTN